MTPKRVDSWTIQVASVLWTAVRLPVLALLLAFEPLVTLLCTLACVALTLCAVFFEYGLHTPHFPFWGMLATAVGCASATLCYRGLIRFFGR